MDRYLTFNHHVSELCRKAAKQVNCLMRLSTMLLVESKPTIFNAFIVSNFLYCTLVWHIFSKSVTNKGREGTKESIMLNIYKMRK